jgi:hypothetical protein
MQYHSILFFKRLTSILAVGVVFASCTTVYFDQPQPKDGIVMTEFPEEVQGTWNLMEQLGSLKIELSATSMTMTEYEKDSITNQNVIKKSTEVLLGDSIILKDCKSFYVMNLKEKENQYQVVTLMTNDQNDLLVYSPKSLPFWKNSCKLKLDSVIVSEGGFMGGGEERVQKNFEISEGENINTIFYSGLLKSKHLKKMHREDNLLMILKRDGTIEFK